MDSTKNPENKDVPSKKKSKRKEQPKTPPPKEANTYRLIDIISHLGNSPYLGHYINDSFDFKKWDWFTYSDLQV